MQHAKRTQTLPTLPPYQTELTQAIVREVRAQDSTAAALLAPFGGAFDPAAAPDTACALLVAHLAMRRNKRCLLAYHGVRAARIEEAVWAGRDALEGPGGQPEGSNLSPGEEEFARAYADLVAAYKARWTDVDLTGALEPPRELFVDVRVLRDAGEIQTEYG